MKEVNLETMNLQELKALAYDIIISIQNDQNVLQQVNQQIAKLQKIQEPLNLSYFHLPARVG